MRKLTSKTSDFRFRFGRLRARRLAGVSSFHAADPGGRSRFSSEPVEVRETAVCGLCGLRWFESTDARRGPFGCPASCGLVRARFSGLRPNRFLRELPLRLRVARTFRFRRAASWAEDAEGVCRAQGLSQRVDFTLPVCRPSLEVLCSDSSSSRSSATCPAPARPITLRRPSLAGSPKRFQVRLATLPYRLLPFDTLVHSFGLFESAPF